MSSKTRAVIGAIKALIEGIDGTSGYVHDLSGAGAVQVGRASPGEGRIPGVWIDWEGPRASAGPELGSFTRSLDVTLIGQVAATADTTEERRLTAADLADDLCAALEADRQLGGLVLDLSVSCESWDGGAVGLPGLGVVGAAVTITWWATSGEGL